MEDDDDDEDRKQRQNLMVLVAVVVLVAGSIWLLTKYREYRDAQDCFLAGHRNCARMDNP